jgi:uncharacterized protein
MYTPFRQFVLKVHSRCDLACDHCYVYEHADNGWLRQPARMTVDTMAHLANRIGEHAKGHGLTEVHAVLHGGEPLLCGPEHLSALIGALRSGLRGACDLNLGIHTNGVLLDRRFCELFRASGVTVGISLDGDRSANDRHRRYRDGRSSFDKATKAIELLRTGYPDLFAGLLCTIDVRNDPTAVYEALVGYDPPAIELLLPHATWDAPPLRTGDTDYADWLAVIFDRWLSDGRPLPVRMFDSILSTGRGGPALTESLGLEPSDVLVVETDGTFEQADSIKVAFDGAPFTGMNVFQHTIDEVGRHEGIAARQGGLAGLSATCRSCPVVNTCGGGLFAHRYRTGSGFDNPSVFCIDLKKLIEHVEHRASGPRHAISGTALRSIAGGTGTAEALTALDEGQRSIRRALVASVSRRLGPSPAWELLCQVEPAIVDGVLAQPFTRAWAVRRLRDPRECSAGRLAAIACVAAARASLDARLSVPAHDGFVYLPTIGAYATPGRRSAMVVIHGGQVEVEGASGMAPVRRMDLGGLTVVVEDLDPFRDCHDAPVADRLAEEEVVAWQASLRDAWCLIEKDHPGYAPTVRAFLSTVVPLKAETPVISFARDAFGAVGVTLSEDPETLGVLLVHALQRVKIGATLDLLDLFQPSPPVPPDTERLLFDSYARLAVTDLRRRRVADEPDAVVTAKIDRLLASESLTPLGRTFVEEMRGTLA